MKLFTRLMIWINSRKGSFELVGNFLALLEIYMTHNCKCNHI